MKVTTILVGCVVGVVRGDPCSELARALDIAVESTSTDGICTGLFWFDTGHAGGIHSRASLELAGVEPRFSVLVSEAVDKLFLIRQFRLLVGEDFKIVRLPVKRSKAAERAPASGNVSEQANLSEATQSIIVLGNWGMVRQPMLAKTLSKVQERFSGSDGVFLLGSRFFSKGATAPEPNPLFAFFQSSIAGSMECPFFPVLGEPSGEGQVSQSWFSDPRWRLGESNFRFERLTKGDSLSVCVWFVDTNREAWDFEQMDWLESSMLSEMGCTWTVVVGYHVVFSAGEYSDSQRLQESLLLILQKHEINLYISAAEQQSQVLKFGTTTFLISGAAGGAEGRTEKEHPFLDFQNSRRPAFLQLEFSPTNLYYAFHYGDNSVMANPMYKETILFGSAQAQPVCGPSPVSVSVGESLGSQTGKVADKISIVAFGDWGRAGSAMNRFAEALHTKSPDAVFLLGDNFYPVGIRKSMGLTDPQFAEFTDVLARGMDCPFYVVMGNHDYLGCAQSQISYSGVNPQWRFPSNYYFSKFSSGSVQTCVWFLDTDAGKFDALQARWLAESINQHKAEECTWKVALGHHPIYTGGEYRCDKKLGTTLLPILQANDFDLYISGHEHMSQALKDPRFRLLHVIAGAVSEMRRKPGKGHEFLQFSNNQLMAFLELQFEAEKILVNFRNAESTANASLWTTEVTRRP